MITWPMIFQVVRPFWPMDKQLKSRTSFWRLMCLFHINILCLTCSKRLPTKSWQFTNDCGNLFLLFMRRESSKFVTLLMTSKTKFKFYSLAKNADKLINFDRATAISNRFKKLICSKLITLGDKMHAHKIKHVWKNDQKICKKSKNKFIWVEII